MNSLHSGIGLRLGLPSQKGCSNKDANMQCQESLNSFTAEFWIRNIPNTNRCLHQFQDNFRLFLSLMHISFLFSILFSVAARCVFGRDTLSRVFLLA